MSKSVMDRSRTGRHASEEVLGKLWEGFDESERSIVTCLAHSAPPVSIDTLLLLSGAPAVTILRVVGQLEKKKVVYQKKAVGTGVYFVQSDIDLAGFVQKRISKDEIKNLLKRITTLSADLPDEQKEETTLTLASLSLELGEDGESLKHMRRAADILYHAGQKSKAVTYYDQVIRKFMDTMPESADAEDFLESIYRKVCWLWHRMSLPAAVKLLKRGHDVAKQRKHWDYLAKMKLLLSLVLTWSGETTESFRYMKEFWKLAAEIEDPGLYRAAVLLTSVFIAVRGKLFEATQYYEKMTGNLEYFGDEEEALFAGIFMAGSYVSTGRIARGMGMFDTIRTKAQSLNLNDMVNAIECGIIVSLIEIRKLSEAGSRLEKLMALPEGAADHILIGFLHNCKAYILSSTGNYEGAFNSLKIGLGYLDSMGQGGNPFCTWIFECLHDLEAHGFSNEAVNFDREIEKAINSNNPYMKGAAYRYRALRNMEKRVVPDSILADLNLSEKFLRTSGGRLELGRTQIATGKYFLEKGDLGAARSYLEKAWNFFSAIDKKLFPENLLNVLPPHDRIKLTLERITRINESLGTLRDTPTFLERVLNFAIDFSMGTRAAFIVLDPDGTPKIVASRNLDTSSAQREDIRSIEELVLRTARQDDKFTPSDTAGVRTEPPKPGSDSLVCMPVRLGDTTYGYLYLDKPLRGTLFPQEHLPFFRMLCSQTAVGIDNIGMHEELKEQKDRSENEVSFYRQEMRQAGSPETIIGKSQAIRSVIDQIRQVAATDSAVLISGETGVGKELVAKAIHNLSNRKDGPFIPVNLATLPQDLVASELFGHEKGAFTGAGTLQKGRFEVAHGGTLFLDEIGDLPAAIQVKLLRVLQEKVFERLGSSRPIQSDFRIISATNRNLDVEVEKGTFRKDLYYRLNVISIHTPPLRERREDIRLLAHHFIERFGKKMGKHISRVPGKELRKLEEYHWPGNIRELEHFIERAVVLSDGHSIDFSGLKPMPFSMALEGGAESVLLVDVVREHLTKILNMTRWKVKGPNGAALLLGLKPTTLFALMARHKLHRPNCYIPSSKSEGS